MEIAGCARRYFQTLAPELYRFVVATAATQPSDLYQRGKVSMTIAAGD
jgi:hypothetical protein